MTASIPLPRSPSVTSANMIDMLSDFVYQSNQLNQLIKRIDEVCNQAILRVVAMELVKHGQLISIETKRFKTEKELAESRKSFDLIDHQDYLICKKSDVNEMIERLKFRHYGFKLLDIEDGLPDGDAKIIYKWKTHISDKHLNKVTLLVARIPKRAPELYHDYVDVILSNDGGETYCPDFVDAVRHTVSYKPPGGVKTTLSKIFDDTLVHSISDFCERGATFQVHGIYTLIGCHPDEKYDILNAYCLMRLCVEEINNPQGLKFKLSATCIPTIWEKGVDFHLEYSEQDEKFHNVYLRKYSVETEKILKENGALPRYEPRTFTDVSSYNGTLSQFNESIRQEIERFRKEQHQNFKAFYAGEYKSIITKEYKAIVTGESKEEITEEYREVVTRKYKEAIANECNLHTNSISLPRSPRKRGRSLAFTSDSRPTSVPEHKNSNYYKTININLSIMFDSIVRLFV